MKTNMMKFLRTVYSTAALFALAYFGFLSQMQAVSPAPDGGYAGGNTAEGQNTLFSLTTGTFNTAIGFFSLRNNTTNGLNTAVGAGTLLTNTADENTAVGAGALLGNTTGTDNTASGVFALADNTAGFDNTAVGGDALQNNSTGKRYTATGVGALEANTFGDENTAVGVAALVGNTGGGENVALGVNALLSNTTGSTNTAVGRGALFNNTSGNNNAALGAGAGLEITTGVENIDIGNAGVAGDSNTIRIGDNNFQTATYVGGIAGQTVGAGGTTCYVDNDGKLGVFLSARRYKESIQPMDKASAALYSLKPITFRYKPEFDKSGTPQFGLIAEEVAAVNPDLIVRNAKGEVSTVRYEAINVMLLNEFLKEHQKVEKLEATVAELAAQLREINAQLQTNNWSARVAASHQ